MHIELVYQMKLVALRRTLELGEQQARNGQLLDYDMASIISEAKKERSA